MSDLNSFTLFPLLPLEIRLMIWELTLFPRIFSLFPKAYNWAEDTSAVAWHLVSPSSTENIQTLDPKQIVSARFLISGIHSHAALEISRESRLLVFSRGYRVWKMQNRQGHVRNVMWNPAVDVILFPPVVLDAGSSLELRVHYNTWLRLFMLQYPEETKIACHMAMHTSMALRSRPWGGRWHWLAELARFQSLRELVIVVDEVAERSMVRHLVEKNKSQMSQNLGPWKIPQEIEDFYEVGKQRRPDLIFTIPDVRVVESTQRVMGSQSLQICLHCNPCEYLGIG